MIRQRRRWLNGSFFAGLYAMKEWSRLYTESGHSLWRKIILTFQLVYMSVNLCMFWIYYSFLVMTLTQVANMYLTFAIVLNSEFGSGSVTSYCLNAIYLTITGIQVGNGIECESSSFMLLEMIHEITRRFIDYHILSMDLS